jgi:Cu/Zn superoxide dismutase
MKAFNLLFLSGAGLVLAASEPAPVILNNVPGSCALADLSTKLAGSNDTFRIEVAVEAASDRRGVNVTINMNGGPGKSSGPYSMLTLSLPSANMPVYHIHEKPVPSDDDCKATGGHLDPTERGESPECDPRDPSSCQVGDLAGIFGNCSTLTSCSKS